MNQAQATFDNNFFREIKPLLKIFTVGMILMQLAITHYLSSILCKSNNSSKVLNKK